MARCAAVSVTGTTLHLVVHTVPGARHAGILGHHDDALKIAVTAPATDGRANAALIDVIADALAVRRAAVAIIHGHTARRKRLRIEADSPAHAADIAARLGQQLRMADPAPEP
jgi:uncharacterized protein